MHRRRVAQFWADLRQFVSCGWRMFRASACLGKAAARVASFIVSCGSASYMRTKWGLFHIRGGRARSDFYPIWGYGFGDLKHGLFNGARARGIHLPSVFWRRLRDHLQNRLRDIWENRNFLWIQKGVAPSLKFGRISCTRALGSHMPEKIWTYDRTTDFNGGKRSSVMPRRGSVPSDQLNRQFGLWNFQKTLYPGVRNHFLIQNKKPVDWIIPIGVIVETRKISDIITQSSPI